jgi:hypothetical protein
MYRDGDTAMRRDGECKSQTAELARSHFELLLRDLCDLPLILTTVRSSPIAALDRKLHKSPSRLSPSRRLDVSNLLQIGSSLS